MKNSLQISILVLNSLFFASTSALAGFTTSAGGRMMGNENNPWFVEKAVATYCVEKSNDFSQDLESAVSEFENAIKDWEGTVQSLDVAPLKLQDKSVTLTKSFKRVSTCSKDVDLRVLLGITDERVLKLLGSDIESLYAVAGRETFHESTGQSQGFIWFAPDSGRYSRFNGDSTFWQRGKALYLLSLHELGHVFGFQHNNGAFMDEGWPDRVVQDLTSVQIAESMRSPFLHPLSSRVFGAKQFYANGLELCNGLVNRQGTELAFVKRIFSTAVTKSSQLCFRLEPNKPRGFLTLRDAQGAALTQVPFALERSELGYMRGALGEVSGVYKKKGHTWISFGALLRSGIRIGGVGESIRGEIVQTAYGSLVVSSVKRDTLESIEIFIPTTLLNTTLGGWN